MERRPWASTWSTADWTTSRSPGTITGGPGSGRLLRLTKPARPPRVSIARSGLSKLGTRLARRMRMPSSMSAPPMRHVTRGLVSLSPRSAMYWAMLATAAVPTGAMMTTMASTFSSASIASMDRRYRSRRASPSTSTGL